ncbi:MAG: hypothetical protein AB7U98_02170 [Candidatus Nitrosocosmicus sp.]|jgi:hypothetical protein|nr:hypothetical protein [Candidatus Nitrosocosmicus sp.]
MNTHILPVGIIISLVLATTSSVALTPIQSSFAIFVGNGADGRNAPPAISGENIYVAWWTNKTANNNEEVMFRASTDGGATFGNKINLSNTTDSNSVDVIIDAEDNRVVVTWWERNNTADEPVMRISDDAGETFGPMLQLSQNGTLDNSAGE